MGMNETPSAERAHIGFFGRRNAGKSSLVNAVTGQELSVVSPVKGTTTDPVYKSMELLPLGPVVIMDTPGLDDEGELGQLRVEATRDTLTRADVALLVIAGQPSQEDLQWAQQLKAQNTPFLVVQTKGDLVAPAQLPKELAERAVAVSAATGEGIEALRAALTALVPEDFGRQDLTRGLCSAGDVVLLVMPQDIQAPKGRLILPQVRTIRHLLDLKCTVVSTTNHGLDGALAALSAPPKLIITDSQCFPLVAAKKPEQSLLTSFSILMAADKGDIDAFAQGAKAIGTLTENSRVLIAEGCTHAPLEEDIGRVKIPRLLRKRVGQGLQVDVVAGNDFPHDLTGYDLVIHCGGCMFNRAYVLSRLAQAQRQGVPMTNYGVAIAYLTGILEQVSW